MSGFIFLVLLSLAIAALGWMAKVRGYKRAEGLLAMLAPHYKLASIIATIIFIYALVSTSFVVVGNDETGHLKRKYFGKSLPEGRIIAFDGENGPQARILGPGLHFEFLINILNEVEMLPVLQVPNESLAILIASDGKPLREGQYVADAWDSAKTAKMLDAEFFLKNNGQRGPQLNHLTPGTYRINHYLWKYKMVEAFDVPAGHVAVIKSNVGKLYVPKSEEEKAFQSQLSVPLVPKGYIGVWREPLPPGKYYLNRLAYEPNLISTRLISYEYKGGFTLRKLVQEKDSEGNVVEKWIEQEVPTPQSAADVAINAKSKDGFNFPVELRVQAQVAPEDAPFVFASVGGLQQVEDNVLTPTVRAEVRNSSESQTALDFLNARSLRESEIEKKVIPEVKKGGLTVREVRIGEIFIPQELLLTQTRKKIANEMEQTYAAERKAEDSRRQKEKATAEANQQARLVASEYDVKIADLKKAEKEKLGQAEANYLINYAKGQKAQYEALAAVVGRDNFTNLEAIRIVLEKYKGPLVPGTLVQGGSSSLEGAAAILKGTALAPMLESVRGDTVAVTNAQQAQK